MVGEGKGANSMKREAVLVEVVRNCLDVMKFANAAMLRLRESTT